jgi:hypothetical protein
MGALPMVAALLLLAGFGDVARGGITVGPALLAAAYCIVIPAAILRGTLPRRQRPSTMRLSR